MIRTDTRGTSRPSLKVRSRIASLITVLHIAAVCSCSHFTPYYGRAGVHFAPPVAGDEIDHRLLLVGDAGEPAFTGEPTLQLLRSRVILSPERTTVVFLGDNIYERGMPDPIEAQGTGDSAGSGEETPVEASPSDAGATVVKGAKEAADMAADAADVILPDVFESRHEAERYINAQIDVVRGTAARAIFVPGNHDWDEFETGGWKRILNLEDYLRRAATGADVRVSMLPRGGCPGPSVVPLGETGELILLDTQWWLETRPDGKPTSDNNPTACPYTREKEVRDAFQAALEAAAKKKRRVVVAAHHPLATKGPHGGFADIRTHLFPFRIIATYVPFYIRWLPLPVLGSVVVGLRACCSTSPQDFAHRRNRHMRNSVLLPMIEAQRNGARPLVYAAGHDHSLQVFEAQRGPELLLVSGLGSSANASDVGSNRRTLFAHSNPLQPGIMEIDFLKNGDARLAVIERTAAKPEGVEVYSYLLEVQKSRQRHARDL
jgi:hypothetical protein